MIVDDKKRIIYHTDGHIEQCPMSWTLEQWADYIQEKAEHRVAHLRARPVAFSP